MTQTMTRPHKSSNRKAYEPVVLARVYDKTTGECLGYRAPSSNPEKDWYRITCDRFGQWHCDCEAVQYHQKCCHVRAVQELCEIRAMAAKPEQEAPSSGSSIAQVIEEVMAAMDETPDEPIDEEAKWKEWMDELGRDAQEVGQAQPIDEYEAWKHENGLPDTLTREAYDLLFGIYA